VQVGGEIVFLCSSR